VQLHALQWAQALPCIGSFLPAGQLGRSAGRQGAAPGRKGGQWGLQGVRPPGREGGQCGLQGLSLLLAEKPGGGGEPGWGLPGGGGQRGGGSTGRDV
jgi:hypothetical protein